MLPPLADEPWLALAAIRREKALDVGLRWYWPAVVDCYDYAGDFPNRFSSIGVIAPKAAEEFINFSVVIVVIVVISILRIFYPLCHVIAPFNPPSLHEQN